MIDQNVLEKFYSKIFSVPKKRVSIAIGITSIVLASYLNGISGKSFFAMRYFFIGLALIALLILAGRVMKSGFNSRRIFFFALFMLILVEVGDVIAIHLLNPELIVVSPSAIAFILSVALYFTSERFSYLAPLAILSLLYPVDYMFSFSVPNRSIAYALSSLSGVFLSYLFISFMSRKAGRIVVSDILRDFVLYWLKSDPGIFEKRLEMYSKTSIGKVHTIKFNNCSVFIPEFHPGPFRDVGGSKLVEMALQRYDMFLHGVSGHDRNPTTAHDVRAILNAEFDFMECSAKIPYTVHGRKFWVKVYPFECFNLIIVHGRERIDDLPSQVREYAETFFANPVVVDAHSAYGERYEMSPSDMAEIYSLIRKAGDFNPESAERLRVCYSTMNLENERICGKVGLLLFEFDGERHGILMVDSNNMSAELRDHLVEIGKKSGVELDIVTTDNHSKTGVSPKIGYEPADMRDSDLIGEFVDRSLSCEMEESSASYGSAEVSVTVMGEEFFRDIDTAFRKYGEKGIYLFALFSFLNYVMAFLLSYIII